VSADKEAGSRGFILECGSFSDAFERSAFQDVHIRFDRTQQIVNHGQSRAQQVDCACRFIPSAGLHPECPVETLGLEKIEVNSGLCAKFIGGDRMCWIREPARDQPEPKAL
jgi:hypothetical protein